jgi:serine/threonine protein kinase
MEHVLRFKDEARLTGRLAVRGIVAVYDFGYFPDGRLYYAMELVRGSNLLEEIRRAHATDAWAGTAGRGSAGERKLIAAIAAVARTLERVHQLMVIHRDIKPSNILLDCTGEPMIADWGCAKSVDPGAPADEEHRDFVEDGSHQTFTREAWTCLGSRMGTPVYSSPEQVLGMGEVGRASDIYNLGATLYHAVSGRTPYEGSGRMEEVALKMDGAPELRPARVHSGIPPALDAICAKAMARRPEDRYASAAAFEEDLGRWLEDEPVSVYSDPFSKRVERLARRHRVFAAVLSFGLLIAPIGLGVTLWVEHRNLGKVTRLANENASLAAKAQEQTQFAIDLVQSAVAVTSETYESYSEVIASLDLEEKPELIRESRERLPKLELLLQRLEDLELEEPAQLLELARGYHTLARLERDLGFRDKSRSYLERAAQVMASISQGIEDWPQARELLGSILVEQSRHLREEGKYAEERAILKRAVHLLCEGDPERMNDEVVSHAAQAEARLLLGASTYLARNVGGSDEATDLQEAERNVRAAIELYSQIGPEIGRGAFLAPGRLAIAQDHLSWILAAQGRWEAAESTGAKAIRTIEMLCRKNPKDYVHQVDACRVRVSQARLMSSQGQWNLAKHRLLKAIERYPQLLELSADRDQLESEFRGALRVLAGVQQGLREFEQRVGTQRQILAHSRLPAGTNRANAPARLRELAQSYTDLGVSLTQTGRLDEGLLILAEAENCWKDVCLSPNVQPDDQLSRTILRSLAGWIHVEHGRFETGVPLLQAAGTDLRSMRDDPATSGRIESALATCHAGLGRAAARRGDLALAERELSEASSLWGICLSSGSPSLAAKFGWERAQMDLGEVLASRLHERTDAHVITSERCERLEQFLEECVRSGTASTSMLGWAASVFAETLDRVSAETRTRWLERSQELCRQAVERGWRPLPSQWYEARWRPLLDRREIQGLIDRELDRGFPSEALVSTPN